MNIPTAADAKAASLEARAKQQQAALDAQAKAIEQRIQECIADGTYGFSLIGRMPAHFRQELEQKGYLCAQLNHPDGAYFSIEWETPNRATL